MTAALDARADGTATGGTHLHRRWQHGRHLEGDPGSERDGPRIRGLRLRRNFGKSAALSAGFAASTGPVIATLDGDLQDDPAEIPGMVALLGDSADLVAGRKARRRDPVGKRLPSKVFNFFTGVVTGLKLRDHNCGLKVARREVFVHPALRRDAPLLRRDQPRSGLPGGRAARASPASPAGRSKFGLERYARGGLDLLPL